MDIRESFKMAEKSYSEEHIDIALERKDVSFADCLYL